MSKIKSALLVGLLVVVVGGIVIWRSQFTTWSPDIKLDVEAIEGMKTFDNSDWAFVLKTYVDEQGRVDYAGLKASPEPLYRYVAMLGKVGPNTREDLFPTTGHMLAYYINAYNALTLYNVIERYPIKSVRDDRADFFVFTRFGLDNEDVSLHLLETKLILKKLKKFKTGEPRVHFALNCASVGCPRLPQVPFEGAALEQQLAQETREFLSEPRNYTVEDGVPVISQIFQWYGEQFTPDPLTWISDRMPAMKVPQGVKPKFRPYDWSLNDQAR